MSQISKYYEIDSSINIINLQLNKNIVNSLVFKNIFKFPYYDHPTIM